MVGDAASVGARGRWAAWAAWTVVWWLMAGDGRWEMIGAVKPPGEEGAMLLQR